MLEGLDMGQEPSRVRYFRLYSIEKIENIEPNIEYTVNGLRLQPNVASAVLTQIELECTCSVPKV